MEVITGLENDLEEVKALMRSSSTAYASAAKALVRLRSGREEYMALAEAVRQGSQTIPTQGDVRSSDLLSPLLLLLSHKDVPTSGVCASLSGVQRLAQAGLLSAGDGENICNMLDQLLVRRDHQIDTKLLQTCTVMAISPSNMLSLEVCGKLVILSSRIADEERTRGAHVRNTAIACMIQISTAVLERASRASWGDEVLITASTLIEELVAVPQRNETASGTKAGFLRHVGFFNRSSSGTGAVASTGVSSPNKLGSARSDTWIEPNKISNKDALEVLDSILVLVEKHGALRTSLSSLIADRVGPLVVALLRGKFREQKPDLGYPFAFHVRLMRVTRGVMSLPNMPVQLVSTCLEEMLLVLESSSEIVLTPIWQYVITLEALLSAFEQIRGFLFGNLPLVKRTMDALCKLMRLEPVEEEQEQVFWSSQYKSRGLELLSDPEPPSSISNPVLVVLVSLECLVVVLADGMLGEEMIRVGLLLKRPTGSTNRIPSTAPSVLGQVHRQVLEQSWRPCLAAMSQLLTACQEETAVQYLLRAYLSITTSCSRVGLVEARDAFISNMCEVALPSSLINGQVRLLNRKHLQVLKTLFNVAHGLGEMLGTSWHIVLETFEELDFVLHVQKNNLLGLPALEEGQVEEEIDAETGMIDSMLNNLFTTSTFLTDDAMLHLVIALSSMIFTNVSTAITSSPSQSGASSNKPLVSMPSTSSSTSSASRRLMETLTNTVKAAISLPPNSPVATNVASGQYNAPPSMLPTVDVHDVRFPPFCFEKLLETAELNFGRITVIWDVVSSTLLTLASEADAEPRIRLFAVKSLEKLVTKMVSVDGENHQLRLDMVKRFTLLVRSPQMDTREFALQALHRFVSSAGYRLEGLWNLIVAELLIVSLQPNKTTSALAFKVVQLIMDDYRPSLDMGCLPSLALCLRAFGEQQHDVNMSLTSVHHLWLLCEKGDESLVFVVGQPAVPTEESLLVANALWMHVFDQLRMLSLDPRMEVRNSALRSLCTNIVQCSDRLTVASWRNCSLSIVLPLIGEIDSKAFSANSDTHLVGERLSTHSEARMTVHHTQDTEEKQWRETRITALQGVAKLVCTIMNKIPTYRELEWFDSLWTQVLQHVERTLASNSPAKSVVTGAVSVLEEISMLVCGAKLRTKYAVPGMKVENGALITSVPSSPAPLHQHDHVDQSQHVWLWDSLLQVFYRLGDISPPPFDANVATLLVGVMADLFEDKDIAIVRTKSSLSILLPCCTGWAIYFSNILSKKNHFISPLERNVIKFLQYIPPISWENDGLVWNQAVLPYLEQLDGIDQDEFHAKLHLAYLEFLSQAPATVRSKCLKDALARAIALPLLTQEEEEHDQDKQQFRVDEILFLGLEALDLVRDLEVWDLVFDLASRDALVLDVLMDNGLILLSKGRVPDSIRRRLLDLLREETIKSTKFDRKVGMIRRFMSEAGRKPQQEATERRLAQEVFDPLLMCTNQLLTSSMTSSSPQDDVEQNEQLLEDLLQELFVLEIYSKDGQGFAHLHLIHLISSFEFLALQPTVRPSIRELCIRKLAWLAMTAWQMCK
ncbi:hypothetical protein BASA81_002617 [Batrachochytrium salamandrivorans]|nr:hypothetical protein BASA81_002617 [Batrachochytrium salamandrivorans]